MLSEEEKKAIENLKYKLSQDDDSWYYEEEIDTVLNLLAKLQKENECYKFSVNKLNSELEEVNWKISELAKIVSQRSNIYWDKDDVLKEINKQYFETKAKKGE